MSGLRQSLPVDVPDVHDPHPALVERFGVDEPLVRQMGSALLLAFILTASYLEKRDPMALHQLKEARDAYLAAANPDMDRPISPDGAALLDAAVQGADAASDVWEPIVRDLIDMVEGLADQQAMSDDWYVEGLNQAKRAVIVQCGAYYGKGNNEAGVCVRAEGHPPISEDRIGHSDKPGWGWR